MGGIIVLFWRGEGEGGLRFIIILTARRMGGSLLRKRFFFFFFFFEFISHSFILGRCC